MPVIAITLKTARGDHVMRLDLDPALPNEATVLSFFAGNMLYEPDIAAIFTRALRTGDIALDIGPTWACSACWRRIWWDRRGMSWRSSRWRPTGGASRPISNATRYRT